MSCSRWILQASNPILALKYSRSVVATAIILYSVKYFLKKKIIHSTVSLSVFSVSQILFQKKNSMNKVKLNWMNKRKVQKMSQKIIHIAVSSWFDTHSYTHTHTPLKDNINALHFILKTWKMTQSQNENSST